MLMSILVVSLFLWLLGLATESMFSGFIHVLLLVAVATAGLGVIQGRKRAAGRSRSFSRVSKYRNKSSQSDHGGQR
jgi:Family of unknown function (DUF5670)